MTETKTTTQLLARFETAQEGLGLLMANRSRQIWDEEHKAQPDQARIDELKAERRELRRVRSGLDFNDQAHIEEVIATYGPQVKAIYAEPVKPEALRSIAAG